jgi:hypothetical protein
MLDLVAGVTQRRDRQCLDNDHAPRTLALRAGD